MRTVLTRLISEWLIELKTDLYGRVQSRRRRQLWTRVSRSLGLGPRPAETRRDPALCRVVTHMEIEWYAHDVHPWDLDLPPEWTDALFADAAVAHTAAAVRRAFDRFPEVDSIHIRVRQPQKPNAVLFVGIVSRADLRDCPPTASAAMTLKLLGVRYRISDGCLEPVG